MVTNVEMPEDLKQIRVKALVRVGNFDEAIKFAEELIQENPTSDNFHLYLEALLYKGEEEAVKGVGEKLLGKADELGDPLLFLRVAHLLPDEDNDLAIRLWEKAFEEELDTPQLVTSAVTVGVNLGLDDREEMRELFQKMGELAGEETKHVRAVPFDEMKEMLIEQRERNKELTDKYFEGEIPLHFWTGAIGTTIPYIFLDIFDENVAIENQLNTFPIMSRNGKLILPSNPPDLTHRPDPFNQRGTQELVMDVTSLILADKLSVLEHVEDIFDVIKLPKSIILFLQQQAEQEARHKPKQKEMFENLLERIGNDEIHVLDTAADEEYGEHALQDVKDTEWIHMLEQARQHDGILVEHLPVRDDHGNMTEVDLGEFESLVTNQKSLLKAVYRAGKIDEEQYELRLRELGDYGDDVSHELIPELMTNLYFAGRTVEQLECQGLMDLILEHFPNTYITKRERIHLENRLKRIEDGIETADQIDELVKHIKSCQPDTYQFLELAEEQEGEMTEEEMREPEHQVLTDLLTGGFSEGCVIWVDDRFISGYGNIKGAPIVGVQELLRKIGEVIPEFEYFDQLIQLREADFRYLPVESGEIIKWLCDGKIKEEKIGYIFEEPDELLALRRYIAGTQLDADRFQIPRSAEAENSMGEARFPMNIFHEISDTLIQVWSHAKWDTRRKRAYSDWIFSNMFVDLFGIRQVLKLPNFERDNISFFAKSAASLISKSVQVQAEDLDKNHRGQFIRWVYQRMVRPRENSEPELLSMVGENIRGYLKSFSEDEYPEKQLEKVSRRLLHRFFQDLPEVIQREIDLGEELSEWLGIETYAAVQIGEWEFDPQEFHAAMARLVNGEVEEVTLYDRTENNTFEARLNPQGDSDLEDGSYLFVLSPKEVDEELPSENPFLPWLQDDRDTIRELVRDHIIWFDRPEDEVPDLVDEIISKEEYYQRVELIRKYRQDSFPHHHKIFAQKVKEASNQIKYENMLPPSPESISNYLRFSEVNGDFDSQLNSSAESFVNEGNLKMALDRFSHLPCYLPNPIHEAIDELESDERGTLLKDLLDDWHSTIRRVHLFNLLLEYSEEDQLFIDKAKKISREVLDPEGAHVEAFIAILKWVNRELNGLKYDKELSNELYLIANWVQASSIHEAYREADHEDSDVMVQFVKGTSGVDLLTFDREFDLWNDVSHPRRVRRKPFLFYGLFMGLGIKFDSDLVEQMEIEEEIIEAFLVGEEPEMSIHPEFMSDPSLCQNRLDSFLGFDESKVLEGIFGEEIAFVVDSEVLEAQTEQALKDALENPDRDIAWTLLHSIVDSKPIYQELEMQLEQVLDGFEFETLFEIDEVNARMALDFFGTQIGYLDDDEHRSKLFGHLKERSRRAAKRSDGALDVDKDTELSKEAETIVQTLLESSITEYEPQLSAERFSERMEELVRIWPEMAPLFRNAINNFVWKLPLDQAAPLWRLNLVLRSCY